MLNLDFDTTLAVLIVALGGCGTYLLLPHRQGIARRHKLKRFAALVAGLALLLFASLWRPPSPFLATVFFYMFAIGAIAGGVLTITTTNPVHSALWFASVVLATAGLFVFAGAPFLAAGTIIVYAGAIVVTFLFVIMLAQLEGHAGYDRAARSPARATMTCFVMFWCLIYVLSTVRNPSAPSPAANTLGMVAGQGLATPPQLSDYYKLAPTSPIALVLDQGLRPTARLVDRDGREKPNTAGLGESLYSDHLLTAGFAGVLLFVALIGAVAVAGPRRAEESEPAQSARKPAM